MIINGDANPQAAGGESLNLLGGLAGLDRGGDPTKTDFKQI